MNDDERHSVAALLRELLHNEILPVRDDVTVLKTEMKWVKWGVVLILGALVTNTITALGGPTPPEQAVAVYHYLA